MMKMNMKRFLVLVISIGILVAIVSCSDVDEETFELFLKYQLSVCERSDMMGASSHVVDVVRK